MHRKSTNRSPTNQKLAGGDNRDIPNILKDTDPAKAGMVPAPVEDFVSWYKKIQHQFNIKPYVEISNPDKFVSQIYYRSGDKDIFFFSNYNALKEYVLQAKFTIEKKNAWLWDPQTGERFLYPLHNGELQIHLGPGESKLIVFDNEEDGQKFTEPDLSKKTSIIIQSPWKLTLKDTNGKSRSINLSKLIDFSQREDLKTFGGTDYL